MSEASPAASHRPEPRLRAGGTTAALVFPPRQQQHHSSYPTEYESGLQQTSRCVVMGRIQGSTQSSRAVSHGFRRQQVHCCYGSLVLLCLFCSAPAFAQASADDGNLRPVNHQMDVPNPFATPWLLNDQAASASPQAAETEAERDREEP